MGRIVGHYAPRLLLGIVATLVVLTLVPAAADLVPWPASLALLTGAVLLGDVSHQRRLQWCPYCRNGGEEQRAPTTPSQVSPHIWRPPLRVDLRLVVPDSRSHAALAVDTTPRSTRPARPVGALALGCP